ncbi:DUF6053 domain-containing protein [Lysobacter enzymogenes]|uniref:DUF6053 domain-containing protein n=1 Tax=Lysobacter enzymogenes TaxID=69 RepID=UPI003D2F817E
MPRAKTVGGPSGPTLSAQIAAIRTEGIGPEGPPTAPRAEDLKAPSHFASSIGPEGNPDAP